METIATKKYADATPERILPRFDKDELLKDWFYALKFFLSRIFYGGRNINLSNRYRKRTELLLTKKKSFLEASWKTNAEWEKTIEKDLEQSHIPEKPNDRKMVIQSLEKVSEIPEYNIVKYYKSEIEKKNSRKPLKTSKK